MAKSSVIASLARCMAERKLCKVKFRYDAFFSYFVPLLMNERFFLSAEEDHFQLDGYTVRRIRDVAETDAQGDLYNAILAREGILDSLAVPEVDLAGWETVFRSLDTTGRNIIVEMESLYEEECEFIIGRIEKISDKFVYIRHFDADGVWENEPVRMYYSDITSVTFASRYVDVYSKYLGPLPDNFRQLKVLQIDIVN